MNIDYEIVESAKTEFSELKNKRYHLDYVGKTKDKIYIHIEFQARFPTKKELQRIFAYVALLHEYTGWFVETYIICVQAIPNDQIIYQYSKDNVFKINIMSLKNIDGNKKINSISKKIENNEKLTPTEILALKLMPFTSYKETTEEITLKTAQLTNKITTLTIDELNNIKYIQQAVCSKVTKKEHQQPIMEEIKMRNQKGVTLIALVITIIVLLILAGVSIAMLTGDNGILTKASSSNETNSIAQIKEDVSLAVSEIMANKADPTYNGNESTLSIKNIATIAARNDASLTITTDSLAETEITDSSASFDVTVNKITYTVTYTPKTASTASKIDVVKKS